MKQRDNNVWILTVTILNPHGSGTSPFHTHCIAIGKSSSDHTPIIEYFLKELETIREDKMRFCGAKNKFIKTAFVPLLWSTDRPERASILHVNDVPSTYGLRSHVAAEANFNTLPYCNRCFSAVVGSIGCGDYPVLDNNFLCTDCCRWDYFSDSPAAKANALPENYPTIESSDSPIPPANRTTSETFLVSCVQDFDWLKSGALFAYHNAVTEEVGKRWRQNVMYPFLRSMAINEKVQALNWKSANGRNKGAEDNKPYVPYLWRSGAIHMYQFICAPMHLLCHGVAADVIELVDKFLKQHRLGSKFESFANKYLLEIFRFKLGWCKVRHLPKKNWLAEDILGFSRVMPCLYSLFFLNHDVAETHKTTVSTILQMLHTFHVMLSALMNPSCSSHADKIESYIKLFLSCTHRSIILITGSNAWWEKKGNFLSLLNLPRQIQMYGPIRLYWESVCERFIQLVKPYLLVNMRKTQTYFQLKLTLIHRMNTVALMKNQLNGRITGESSRDSGKGFYRYKTLDEIRNNIRKGMPLSVFEVRDMPNNVLWLAFGRTRESINLIAVEYTSQSQDRLGGLVSLRCMLCLDKQSQVQKEVLSTIITSHAILFPTQTGDSDGELNNYVGLFDDWDAVQDDCTKGEVKLCKDMFEY